MSRIDILKNSLVKKEASFDAKLQNHMDDVRSANGQPMNDKRNGHVTLNRWERQNDSLRNLKESIQKTKDAIERVETKNSRIEYERSYLPTQILDLLEAGKLTQWGKHPHIFFVPGVDKARISWDDKTKTLSHSYVREIQDKAQYAIFRDVFNALKNSIHATKN